MTAKRPSKAVNDKDVQAAARKTARSILSKLAPDETRLPISYWGSEQRVHVFREAGGHPVDPGEPFEKILITRGGELVLVIMADHAAPWVLCLVEILEEQAMIAGWTWPFASSDIAATAGKIKGARDGGRKSANPHRETVERMVKACIDSGEDPGLRAAEWAEAYGYRSVRQIRNIIKIIQRNSLT